VALNSRFILYPATREIFEKHTSSSSHLLLKSLSNWAPVARVCNPSYLEAEIGRIMVQAQPRQIVLKTPISKITRAKWTGGVAQAVELEALSSNKQTKNICIYVESSVQKIVNFFVGGVILRVERTSYLPGRLFTT
jgi:hypothetical protein